MPCQTYVKCTLFCDSIFIDGNTFCSTDPSRFRKEVFPVVLLRDYENLRPICPAMRNAGKKGQPIVKVLNAVRLV